MFNKEIKDVFFDLDHTLWDFDKNSALAFQRVFLRHNINLELSVFIKEYEPINLKYWRKFRQEIITTQELRRGRLTDVFAVFRMKYPLETIDDIANSYLEELPVDNHLFAGTFETLDYLSNNYNLHIITNGFEKVQHSKLENSGIQKYFSTVTTSEDAGAKKPHPLIFERALIKAEAIPQESIMIGDSLEADIIGAQNAGMNTLFFNYRKENIEGSIKSVSNLLEIKAYL
ncbi:MAG TPA: YjjG family noncanonical pyrimidine nucleotidase [Aequorivita sp.]|nr:YjjG family noncanonical pyrimidine nucleotidase [Aequorivita sp.]